MKRKWGTCIWEDSQRKLPGLSREPGRIDRDIYFISPEMLWITLADGLWRDLGEAIDEPFDYGEESTITVTNLSATVRILRAWKQKYEERITDPGATAGSEWLTMSKAVMAQRLEELAEFFDDARRNHQAVSVLL